MNPVYIQNCATFSDAINTLKFELRVPEYYDTSLPDYFKQSRQRPNPIVNGEEVTWEEYLALYPDYQDNNDFIPKMIYRSEDDNMTITFNTVAEIIDLIDNRVTFDIVHREHFELITGIMDGYVREIGGYAVYNPDLKMYLDRLNAARMKLKTTFDVTQNYIDNTTQHFRRGPLTLAEILDRMSGRT